jgi:transglutaminase superfamily protein
MFEEFMGQLQGDVFDNPGTRRGCTLWLERVLAYFGEGSDGGIDIEIIEGQLGLCQKTAEHLYSDFTPLEISYQPGSRPLLEKTLAGLDLSDNLSQRQKMLIIMRRCRDNRDYGLAGKGCDWCGGSEEDLLKRGAIMCNEISRVFVCLCQIAGLPARVFCSHITGHMMAEVYTEGKWGWVDPMKGVAPLDDQGQPASAWQLFQDPKLFERQSQSIWDDLRPPAITFGSKERDSRNLHYTMARNRDCYFHPAEAVAIGNYFVWDFAKYNYNWHIDSVEEMRLKEARYQLVLLQKKMNWPDHFFNAGLFNEQLAISPCQAVD